MQCGTTNESPPPSVQVAGRGNKPGFLPPLVVLSMANQLTQGCHSNLCTRVAHQHHPQKVMAAGYLANTADLVKLCKSARGPVVMGETLLRPTDPAVPSFEWDWSVAVPQPGSSGRLGNWLLVPKGTRIIFIYFQLISGVQDTHISTWKLGIGHPPGGLSRPIVAELIHSGWAETLMTWTGNNVRIFVTHPKMVAFFWTQKWLLTQKFYLKNEKAQDLNLCVLGLFCAIACFSPLHFPLHFCYDLWATWALNSNLGAVAPVNPW